MEKRRSKELTHEQIRKTLGLKGDHNPALSAGLLEKMHQVIRDHNLPHERVGSSVGLNVKKSNKFLSYPHLKVFSTDKHGKVRMFFLRNDEAKAEVRRLYEKHYCNPNAVAFDLGLDLLAVKNLLGKPKPVSGQGQNTGMVININGKKFPFTDVAYPKRKEKK